ncbi:archease [Streptomyces sp. RB6PN25]|uniref:Archease n=1 Tax=Streptomyces humicola TaxID=2953240 RepID=A0ABT1Q3I1_9ACTN|nr:archease [Streptomyces humicola]MCQ4083890.1 archease [Streptomyces humicola]
MNPADTVPSSGHRSVPHTADLRVEAWGATREECLAEAVRAVVESFVDLTEATAQTSREAEITANSDEDLLVALLEELVYWLDTASEVPVAVDLDAMPGGVRARFRMADADSLPVTGATPKAVTLHQLTFSRGPDGFRCSVTLDV